MKWVAILLFLPVLGFTQGVKVSMYDNFIKKHRIEMEPVVMLSSSNTKLSITFSSVASNLFLDVSGFGWGAATIDNDNEMIFLFSNDSTVTVTSVGLQSFEPGLNAKNSYKHQYRLNPKDVQAFTGSELVGIRKYSFREFSDIEIQKENRGKLQRSSTTFLAELKKTKVIKTVKNINLKDIANNVGDSVIFCSKIYNTRYYETSENSPTVLDVQSNFSDPFVNVVIMKGDRANFFDAPEKLYLNKEACISGIVALRNNLPYVIVSHPNQIKVQTKPTLEDIALFVGDSITVKGQVYSAKYFTESATNPTLLNLGAPFPDQPLTVVIEKEDRVFFEPNPELFYLNKEISVSGKVELFKGKPQITVRSKEQLQVVNDNSVVMASLPASNTKVTNSTTDPARQKKAEKAELNKVDKPDVKAAQFPGGEYAWTNFLNENLKLPEQLTPGEYKTVTASFYVNTDGTVEDIKVLQSAGEKYDEEVLRVLRMMPKWKPKQVGTTVMGVIVTQPITFKWESPQ